MNDSDWMLQAVELAKKGIGRVNPNPLVGAVIVKDNRLIGQGFHEQYGKAHAERNALAACTESPKGATLYVTLEPCCHQGKTPPCTQAIIQSGIKKVVIGSSDPNPLVAGKGICKLRSHGITVIEHVEQESCDRLNTVFFHFIQKKTPYVIMKYAMTMDGKTATRTGESKWITGKEARRKVHLERNRCSAIMVGIGTVLHDDPMLTCRIERGRNPLRIICDTGLSTPLHAKLVTTASHIPTLIATSITDCVRHAPYLEAGCEILVVPKKGPHLDLNKLMAELGRRQIDSLLLEGGGTLNQAAISCGIVHKVQTYIAPKLFGESAFTPLSGQGVFSPQEAFCLTNMQVTQLGNDLCIESEVQPCSQES